MRRVKATDKISFGMQSVHSDSPLRYRSCLQSMRRVKATDKISFPVALDMAPFLAGEASPSQEPPAAASQPGPAEAAAGQQYELAAILVHKGGSATHGHYGAPCLHARACELEFECCSLFWWLPEGPWLSAVRAGCAWHVQLSWLPSWCTREGVPRTATMVRPACTERLTARV